MGLLIMLRIMVHMAHTLGLKHHHHDMSCIKDVHKCPLCHLTFQQFRGQVYLLQVAKKTLFLKIFIYEKIPFTNQQEESISLGECRILGIVSTFENYGRILLSHFIIDSWGYSTYISNLILTLYLIFNLTLPLIHNEILIYC
jgi:hypothetical protein